MNAKAQKLELIQWIKSLEDNSLLDQLYFQVKKTLESKKANPVKATLLINPANGKPNNSEQLDLLEKITDEYASSNEPDLDLAQIFTERTKTNDRKIDFN